MPYINSDRKKILTPYISLLSNEIKSDGEMNFVITKLIDLMYNAGTYSKYKDAIGTLECVKQEYYLRRVRPYEDTKIQENGDVF